MVRRFINNQMGQYSYADQAGKPVYVAPNSANAEAYSQYDKQPNAYYWTTSSIYISTTTE